MSKLYVVEIYEKYEDRYGEKNLDEWIDGIYDSEIKAKERIEEIKKLSLICPKHKLNAEYECFILNKSSNYINEKIKIMKKYYK